MIRMMMALAALVAAAPIGCSPAEDRQPAPAAMGEMPMMGGGASSDERPMMGRGGPMSPGMSGDMMGDMRTIRRLLARHEEIERRVENIPGGVRTWTTSEDPDVAALIRTHVREMKARYERGLPIRMMDPVFRELFETREKASLTYQDVPGGVLVTHTSGDPDVVRLIRQHAHGFVSEAVEQGTSRAMQPTPLPEGYRPGGS